MNRHIFVTRSNLVASWRLWPSRRLSQVAAVLTVQTRLKSSNLPILLYLGAGAATSQYVPAHAVMLDGALSSSRGNTIAK